MNVSTYNKSLLKHNSKEAMYREVLLEACRSDAISDKGQKTLLAFDPKKALFILVSVSLKSYSGQGANSWRTIVLNRECREPGPVF